MRNVLLIIALHIFTSLFATEKTTLTVVLDPGHGGKDPGASRFGYKEKDITLAVALEVGKLIEKHLSDVKTIYTRKKDVTVGLKDRAQIANKEKANLFVSIHVNSTTSYQTTAKGIETFILGIDKQAANLEVVKKENSVITLEDDYLNTYGFDPNDDASYIIFQFMSEQHMSQSFEIANSLQKAFVNVAQRSSRGVKQGGLLVLKESSMPAVLIELGFINNLTEAKYLNSKKGQRDLAMSIFQGIKEYRSNFIKKSGNLTLASNKGAGNQSAKKDNNQPSNKTNKQSPEINNIKELSINSNTSYTIQFLYTKQKLGKNASAFRGITPTSVKEENGYKYMVGEENDYAKILSLHNEVKKKFPDAFIIKLNENNTETLNQKDSKPSAEKYRTNITNQKTTQTNVKPTNTTKKDISAEIEYRVQFLTSPKELKKDNSQLSGIENVKFYKDGNTFKYTSGSFKTIKEATNHQIKIRKKYKDAFVVKFKDDKRI